MNIRGEARERNRSLLVSVVHIHNLLPGSAEVYACLIGNILNLTKGCYDTGVSCGNGAQAADNCQQYAHYQKQGGEQSAQERLGYLFSR